MIKNLILLFYFVINSLFAYKYGLRQNIVPIYILLPVYVLVLFAAVNFKFSTFNKFKITNTKNAYFAISIFIPILLFVIISSIDGNALNVDRWSAMDVAIKALFNGEYPYTAVDHLNGRTSNFPGLLLIGIPFYLLQNVGFLQVFTFIFLAFTLYRCLKTEEALRYLVLLLLSLAYWWEIMALSDLMSNIIIVFCAILLIHKYWHDNKFKHPIFLGVLLSVLILTRGIVFAPLVIFFFKDFLKTDIKTKSYFVLAGLVTFSLLVLMVLVNCPDWETLKNYNPALLQTTLIPWYIAALSFLLPFYLSFRIKKFFPSFFSAVFVIMIFPVCIAFMIRLDWFGFNTIIEQNKFDLSYFSMSFPFMLMALLKPAQDGNKN